MASGAETIFETPEADLVAGMSWLQNTLTCRYNVWHQAWGRLFGDRYKAIVVEGADAYHYRTLADYIHLNPVRARLIFSGVSPRSLGSVPAALQFVQFIDLFLKFSGVSPRSATICPVH